jgi:hypothetical protein
MLRMGRAWEEWHGGPTSAALFWEHYWRRFSKAAVDVPTAILSVEIFLGWILVRFVEVQKPIRGLQRNHHFIFPGSRRIDQLFGNCLNFLTVFSSWVVTLLHSSET